MKSAAELASSGHKYALNQGWLRVASCVTNVDDEWDPTIVNNCLQTTRKRMRTEYQQASEPGRTLARSTALMIRSYGLQEC